MTRKVAFRLELWRGMVADWPLVALLGEERLEPRLRLGFMPALAPLMLGLGELGAALGGGLEEPGEEAWGLFLRDLEEWEGAGGLGWARVMELVWGEPSRRTRQALYGLLELASEPEPWLRSVVAQAVAAAGSALGRAMEPAVRELERQTGRRLLGPAVLRERLEVAGACATLAADAPAQWSREAELRALALVDRVFELFTAMAEELRAYAEPGLRLSRARAEARGPSLLEFGASRLAALCEAVGFGAEEARQVQRSFQLMVGAWGERPVGTTAPWRSDITDDHTPYELSLALDERPEVRFLLEAQREPTTLRSSWEDGLALNERLHRELGASLERFAQVQELFEPRDMSARFSLWHACCLKSGGRPELKVYLNPAARGPEHASALVQEALRRLGLSRAWDFLEQVALRRGARDQPVYFSLDLGEHPSARVKVYVAHREASTQDVEQVLSHLCEWAPGEPTAFLEALHGGRAPFRARPPLTCFAFTAGADERPMGATLHFPLRCYVRSDRQALQRVRPLLEPAQAALLQRAVESLAMRPLPAQAGLLQWASLRWQGGRRRMTFYLATEAYSAQQRRPGAVPRQAPRYFQMTS